MADALKAEGNKAFAEKKFDDAASGAYASLKDFDRALEDANKVTEIKPDWAKGWNRKGAALHGQGNLVEALKAYEHALKLEPSNAQAKSGLDGVKRAIDFEARADGMGGDSSGGLGNMFSDPQLIQKLANNPKTSRLLADPEFMGKLQRIRQNPNSIGAEMQDPRFLQVLGVLLGVDMQFGSPGDGESDQPPASASKDPEADVLMSDVGPSASKSAESKPEPEVEDEDAIAQRKAKEEADAEKKLGTELYKKREFDAAIEHYSKAWDIHKDITFLTNIGAAKFEKGDYNGAIEACQKAIDEGREMLADFKLIAKAFGRIGTAYEKMDDLSNAITNYQRSLTEHRTPEILAKLRAAEKARIIKEKESLVDPVKAEEAREEGNRKFKEADWPGAVEAYTEMIKRAPDDPRGYSNRAAAFIKLMSFPSALQDCDEAIKRDHDFVRAYIRKAQAYFAMREYSKCLDTCTEALEHDKSGANTREIEQQQQKALQVMYSSRAGETEEQTMERIQKDPEILRILQDPVMQSILQQAKDNPASLQEHMKNAEIRSRVQKLVAAGVIRLGR